MRNHQIKCIETLFQLFRGEGILGPNQLNINHLGAGTIKILLFRPLFIMEKTVCGTNKRTRRMDCTTGVYDKLYRRRTGI